MADLEGLQARLHEKDAQIEAQKSSHYQAGDALHAAQGEFYAANAEVSRHEQQLQYARDSQQRLTEQMADVRAQLAALEAQQARAAEELQAAEAALEAAIGSHEQMVQAEQAANQALPTLEQAVRAAAAGLADVDRRWARPIRACGSTKRIMRTPAVRWRNGWRGASGWSPSSGRWPRR